MESLPVPFGEEIVHYAIGPASCAVPGLPAGLEELWRVGGAPAVVAARGACAPAGPLRRGAAAGPRRVSRDARAGDDARARRMSSMRRAAGCWRRASGWTSPGSSQRSRRSPARARAPSTAARSRTRCSRSTASRSTQADLDALRGRLATSPSRRRCVGVHLHTRGGLSGVRELFDRLPPLRGLDETERVLRYLAALDRRRRPPGRRRHDEPRRGRTPTAASAC